MYMYMYMYVQITHLSVDCVLVHRVHDQSRICICKLKQRKANKAKSEGRQ